MCILGHLGKPIMRREAVAHKRVRGLSCAWHVARKISELPNNYTGKRHAEQALEPYSSPQQIQKTTNCIRDLTIWDCSAFSTIDFSMSSSRASNLAAKGS